MQVLTNEGSQEFQHRFIYKLNSASGTGIYDSKESKTEEVDATSRREIIVPQPECSISETGGVYKLEAADAVISLEQLVEDLYTEGKILESDISIIKIYGEEFEATAQVFRTNSEAHLNLYLRRVTGE